MQDQFDIDLTTVGQLGDELIPRLNAVRDRDPLYWREASRCWIVAANDLVMEGFRGSLPLSAKRHEMIAGLFTHSAERAAVIGYVMEVFPAFVVSTDPPDQSRLRRLLMSAFGRAVAEGYRPQVRRIVADTMSGIAGRDRIDFVADVARPITARAILHVMGLSDANLGRMELWAQSITEGLSGNPDRTLLAAANRAMEEMRDVFLTEIKARGDDRGTDFLSHLLNARDGSDRLTRNEVVAQLILLLVAGHDTTLNSVALSIAKLADMADERAYIRDNPDKFDACMMELIRVVAMSAAQARIVSEDFEWRGRLLKRGQIAFLMIAAANRDPAQFAEPERIDFDRSQAANMTFAPGRHFCIGHWFAKMMMSEIFLPFLDAYESWEMLERPIAFTATPVFRGRLHLPIRLRSRSRHADRGRAVRGAMRPRQLGKDRCGEHASIVSCCCANRKVNPMSHSDSTKPFLLLIDGRLTEGAHVLDVINPATGGVAATCARADETQLDQAVAAAKSAFPGWSARSFAERRAMLEAVADAMAARRDEFARLLTMEQGKPLAQALGEVSSAIGNLRGYAAMQTHGRTLREDAKTRIVEQRDPLGVIGAIMPWNFPLVMLILKVGPALITGNTIVTKPAPTTPLTALLFGEVAAAILPPGVLNIIVDDNDLGAALTRHPDIAKISFTGSTATGKKVMGSIAGTLKRLTLELGGNDAAIVLADVDVRAVAPALFMSAMINCGQVCMATKRIYAHASIYDGLCEELARLARDTVVDDGMKQGTAMGPLQNRQQFEKVKGFLEDAHASGKVIAGGAALDREGYFIAPTIVRDIPDSARLVREEQFGPVLPIMSFEDIDDAIARVNDSDYGLAGSVWTADVDHGIAVASRIRAGTVWVNKFLDVPIDVPFRGAKQSGIGAENGQEGLDEYTQARIVNVALAA